ncbi:MAG TPA: hypothetical protein VGS13_01790 [Stellaceae bacterium]|nr:hypothetical protein [Stellaceae bacterium]
MATSTTIDSGTIYDISAGQTDTGDTVLTGGTLTVESGGTASGALGRSVVSSGGGTLEINGTTMPTATISGYGAIDLTALAFSTAG